MTLPTQAAHEASQPAPDPPVPPLPQKPAGLEDGAARAAAAARRSPSTSPSSRTSPSRPSEAGSARAAAADRRAEAELWLLEQPRRHELHRGRRRRLFGAGIRALACRRQRQRQRRRRIPSLAMREWAPATSLFAMGPSEGFGKEAGEFHIGQLVQVRAYTARLSVSLCVCVLCLCAAPLSDLHRVCCVCVCHSR